MRGRTSKYWEITFYGSRWTGPSQFHMDYVYECGVNIPNASDETCSTWKSDGAQCHGSGVAVNNQQIVKNFGMVSLVVVYAISGRECAGVCPGRTSTGEYRSLNRRRATA